MPWVKALEIDSWEDVREQVFGVKDSCNKKLNKCPLSGPNQTNVLDKNNKYTLVYYEDVNCNTEFESTKGNPQKYKSMSYSECIVKMHNSFIKDSKKPFNKENYKAFADKFHKRVKYAESNPEFSKNQKKALHSVDAAVIGRTRIESFSENETTSGASVAESKFFSVELFCSAENSVIDDFHGIFSMLIDPKSSLKFTQVFRSFLNQIYYRGKKFNRFCGWYKDVMYIPGNENKPDFDSSKFTFQSVLIGGFNGTEVQNLKTATEADVFNLLDALPKNNRKLQVALECSGPGKSAKGAGTPDSGSIQKQKSKFQSVKKRMMPKTRPVDSSSTSSSSSSSSSSSRSSSPSSVPAKPVNVRIRLNVEGGLPMTLAKPVQIFPDRNRKFKDLVLETMSTYYDTAEASDGFKSWYISKAGTGKNGAAPKFDPDALTVDAIYLPHNDGDFTESTETDVSGAFVSATTNKQIVDVDIRYTKKAGRAPISPVGGAGVAELASADQASGDSGDTSTIELNWKGPDERSGVIQVTCHPEEQKLIALNNVSIQWTNVWMNYFRKYRLKNIELKFYADRAMKNSLEENWTIAEARDHGVLADNKLYALFTVKDGSTKNPATSSSSKVSPGAKAGSGAPAKDFVNVYYEYPAGKKTRCNVIYDLNGTVKQIADVLMNKYGCKFSIYTDESMKHELTPDMTIKQAKKDLKDSWPDYRILYARAIDLTGSSSPAGSPKKPDTSSRPTHRFGRKTGAGSDRPAVDKTSSSTKKYKINVSCRLKDGKIENCWASFDSNGTVEQIADVLMNKYGCKFSIYTDESMTKILEPGLPIIKSGAQRLYARAIDSTESSSPEGSTTSSGEADVCKSGSIMRLRLTNKQESGVLGFVKAEITHPMLLVKDALGFDPKNHGMFGDALLRNQNFRHAFQNWYSTVKGNGKFGVLDGDVGVLSHTRLELIDTNGNTVRGYNTLRDVWHLRKGKRGEPYFDCNVIFDVSQKSR